MSNSIERMVRPFQTKVVTPPQRVLTDYASEGQQIITLEYGRSGSGKTLSGSTSITSTLYMDTKLKETSITSSFGSFPF